VPETLDSSVWWGDKVNAYFVSLKRNGGDSRFCPDFGGNEQQVLHMDM